MRYKVLVMAVAMGCDVIASDSIVGNLDLEYFCLFASAEVLVFSHPS